MDNRLKELVRAYDKADMEHFKATVVMPQMYSESEKAKALEQKETLYKELYEKYGVTRNSYGDLFMPDGTPIELEE